MLYYTHVYLTRTHIYTHTLLLYIDITYKYPDPAEAYIARPTTYKLDKKRVYNYRKIIFNLYTVENIHKNSGTSTTTATTNSNNNSGSSSNVNVYIEQTLYNAFTLAKAEYQGMYILYILYILYIVNSILVYIVYTIPVYIFTLYVYCYTVYPMPTMLCIYHIPVYTT